MSSPSERAVQAFFRREETSMEVGAKQLEQMLNAAHDPALDLDRSVCLRDVVEALRHTLTPLPGQDAAADFIEREFGGGS